VHYDGAKPQNCIVEKFCTTGGQSLLSLQGRVEKNFFFNFKRYNLTIHVVKCRDTFCTCSPSSLEQDPTVKSAKKWKKNSFGLLELEMADLERFWRKTPLGPLGVKDPIKNYQKIPNRKIDLVTLMTSRTTTSS
jgi:hypothetical protein